jgi:hypothetical protein
MCDKSSKVWAYICSSYPVSFLIIKNKIKSRFTSWNETRQKKRMTILCYSLNTARSRLPFQQEAELRRLELTHTKTSHDHANELTCNYWLLLDGMIRQTHNSLCHYRTVAYQLSVGGQPLGPGASPSSPSFLRTSLMVPARSLQAALTDAAVSWVDWFEASAFFCKQQKGRSIHTQGNYTVAYMFCM